LRGAEKWRGGIDLSRGLHFATAFAPPRSRSEYAQTLDREAVAKKTGATCAMRQNTRSPLFELVNKSRDES